MGKGLPKADLLAEIAAERNALDGLLQSIAPRQLTRSGVTAAGWSIKDILGHVVSWQQMNLEWHAAGLRGERPAVPAPGLTWKDVPKLNDSIFRKHRRRALKAVLADYEAGHHRMLELVRQASNEDLVQVGRFAWAGPSWTLSDYARANTSSHYRWARKHIEKWLRAREPDPG